MSPSEFAYLRTFLKAASGLEIDDDKRYLVENRLAPVCRLFALADLTALVAALRQRRQEMIEDRSLEQATVEAMATHETLFFRDKLPFEQFREIMLPHLLKARAATKRLRIWCAACSTGQEPYSLAMILCDQAAELAGWSVELLATDLSEQALARARSGLFSQFEVQRGLPVTALLKHFTKQGERWQIADPLRRTVDFRRINLLHDFRHLGRFDIILCRNALLYFDSRDREGTLFRLADALEPDGYLVLGSVETAIGTSDRFAPVGEHRGLYRPAAVKPRETWRLAANG